MMRFVSAGVVFLCAIAHASGTTATISGAEQDVLPQPCATDPVYQEFERIQADAYLSDRDLQFRLFLDPDLQARIRQRVIQDLRRRVADTHAVLAVDPGSGREIETKLANLKTPTCYENAALYFMIEKYARDVETARRELYLPLPRIPKFGSLPGNDINAHTYPLLNGRGEVIAINSQLFTFIYKMTALAVLSVDPTFSTRRPSEAEEITQALIAISYNQRAKQDFASAIVGLLLGKPVARGPVNPAQEPLLVSLAAAIERFVFAHEYGHLIKRHLSCKVTISTGATGNDENVVFARTWQQEFEADLVGSQLMVHILRRLSEENPSLTQYFVYALKAPLFFFKCMELLDQAKEMQETGKMPVQKSQSNKALIRRCAEGRIADSERTQCADAMADDHPPAWLREERLQKEIDQVLAKLPKSQKNSAASNKADELLFNLAIFWQETSTQILKQLTEEAN